MPLSYKLEEKITWIGFGLLLTLGLALAALAISMFLTRLRYSETHDRLTGQLIGVSVLPEDRGFLSSPHFTFRPEGGDKIMFKSPLTYICCTEPSDNVTVLYNSEDKTGTIYGFQEFYLPVLVIGIVGFVILLFFSSLP